MPSSSAVLRQRAVTENPNHAGFLARLAVVSTNPALHILANETRSPLSLLALVLLT